MSKRPDTWTAFEDMRLKAARDLDLGWSTLAAKYLPGRSAAAAKARYAVLTGKRIDNRSAAAKTHQVVSALPDGSDMLRASIDQLYDREAKRRGTTPDVVRLILNYSPVELARMHQRAAA